MQSGDGNHPLETERDNAVPRQTRSRACIALPAPSNARHSYLSSRVQERRCPLSATSSGNSSATNALPKHQHKCRDTGRIVARAPCATMLLRVDGVVVICWNPTIRNSKPGQRTISPLMLVRAVGQSPGAEETMGSIPLKQTAITPSQSTTHSKYSSRHDDPETYYQNHIYIETPSSGEWRECCLYALQETAADFSECNCLPSILV